MCPNFLTIQFLGFWWKTHIIRHLLYAIRLQKIMVSAKSSLKIPPWISQAQSRVGFSSRRRLILVCFEPIIFYKNVFINLLTQTIFKNGQHILENKTDFKRFYLDIYIKYGAVFAIFLGQQFFR